MHTLFLPHNQAVWLDTQSIQWDVVDDPSEWIAITASTHLLSFLPFATRCPQVKLLLWDKRWRGRWGRCLHVSRTRQNGFFFMEPCVCQCTCEWPLAIGHRLINDFEMIKPEGTESCFSNEFTSGFANNTCTSTTTLFVLQSYLFPRNERRHTVQPHRPQ